MRGVEIHKNFFLLLGEWVCWTVRRPWIREMLTTEMVSQFWQSWTIKLLGVKDNWCEVLLTHWTILTNDSRILLVVRCDNRRNLRPDFRQLQSSSWVSDMPTAKLFTGLDSFRNDNFKTILKSCYFQKCQQQYDFSSPVTTQLSSSVLSRSPDVTGVRVATITWQLTSVSHPYHMHRSSLVRLRIAAVGYENGRQMIPKFRFLFLRWVSVAA